MTLGSAIKEVRDELNASGKDTHFYIEVRRIGDIEGREVDYFAGALLHEDGELISLDKDSYSEDLPVENATFDFQDGKPVLTVWEKTCE